MCLMLVLWVRFRVCSDCVSLLVVSVFSRKRVCMLDRVWCMDVMFVRLLMVCLMLVGSVVLGWCMKVVMFVFWWVRFWMMRELMVLVVLMMRMFMEIFKKEVEEGME